jgi:sugar (pentulose or hexulose) kinase
MLEALRAAAARFHVRAIQVATHGATAALVDPLGAGNGLVLPVLDYEHDAPSAEGGYESVRPAFEETLSPALPAGLNLGRQLWWQQQRFPAEFARARAILAYPQYWTWRLSGTLVSECTSLGCHTDLWNPLAREFSSLVRSQGWERLLPPLAPAWRAVGSLRDELARETGLGPDCAVYAGVHDSNAGFARHLRTAQGEPFVLVSTGTWVVCMAAGGSVARLDATRDMLANVDVNAAPVPCARFMGGREYARICELTGADPAQAVNAWQVQQTVGSGVFALPDFSAGSGPCAGRDGAIVGAPEHGAALATLYLALMIELEIELLDAPGEILIEGPFAANAMLCGLVAALCARPVLVAGAGEATALGAALLCDWQRDHAAADRRRCEPSTLDGLDAYRSRWREQLHGARGAA